MVHSPRLVFGQTKFPLPIDTEFSKPQPPEFPMIHPGFAVPSGCLPLTAGSPAPVSSSWFFVRVLIALTAEVADRISQASNVHFKSEDMVQPGLFSLYLQPNQVAYLRQCQEVALFQPTPESKVKVPRSFGKRSKYWVKAGNDWAAPPGLSARKVGHQLFEVETSDLDELAKDPAVLRVTQAAKAKLH
jgi:hypothetical protein